MATSEPTRRGRDETELERVDRNLSELTQELRVALPGVQVLFAFLLVVPFQPTFARVSSFERGMYFATLLLTAMATACLIAPSMHHRILFHQGQKAQLVKTANTLTIVGLTLLALAMIGVILLITHVLFGTGATVAATAGAVVVFAALWYAIPIGRR
jgi:hypothetical protein